MLNKRIFGVFLLAFLLCITLGSALDSLPPKTIDEQFTFCQVCEDATYTTLSSIDTPNSTLIINTNMSAEGAGQFCYNYTPVQIGRHDFRGISDGCENSFAVYFISSAYGNEENESTAIIYSLLLLFFIGLIVGTIILNRKMDYEKWNNKIYSRYENKNYIKLVLSSLVYNLMKNTFIIYYLLGLPIILIVTDIAYVFNITNIHTALRSLMIVYVIGLLPVAMLFFAHVQEWVMDLLNKVRDMEWGIE